jgi:hypothetical protein
MAAETDCKAISFTHHFICGKSPFNLDGIRPNEKPGDLDRVFTETRRRSTTISILSVHGAGVKVQDEHVYSGMPPVN